MCILNNNLIIYTLGCRHFMEIVAIHYRIKFTWTYYTISFIYVYPAPISPYADMYN